MNRLLYAATVCEEGEGRVRGEGVDSVFPVWWRRSLSWRPRTRMERILSTSFITNQRTQSPLRPKNKQIKKKQTETEPARERGEEKTRGMHIIKTEWVSFSIYSLNFCSFRLPIPYEKNQERKSI